MDPDVARPSIESDELLPENRPSLRRNTSLEVNTAATIPLPPSSPVKTPYSQYRSPARSASPAKLSRSPSAASSYYDTQTTPTLRSKRSTSSLSVARGATPSKTQFRRASSNLNPASPVAIMKQSPYAQELQRRKELTPATVAKDYFRKELDGHATAQTPVAVIVHDSCYGHRFSRPRTSKAALSTIVERPERILATVLGASTAYVKLGSRHADGRHPPHPDRDAPPHTVPFQIRKTTRNIALNHPSVTHVHGSKWMDELQIMCDSAESKLALNGKELTRPIGYGRDENGNSLPKLHEGDLYLCNESLAALQGCLGGVFDAVDTVFTSNLTKRAFVCIRPPGHHCSSNFPSGFCWLNNVHVGIAHAAMSHGLSHTAIIDFDLHHGDGSQTITWDHNRKAQSAAKNAAQHKKTPIGYYSLHDINSYPCEWGDEDKVRNASLCIENAHGQSIWNVHLEPWSSHQEFWKLYESRYSALLEKARKFLRHHTARLRSDGKSAKAAIFLSAGFDASEHEGAGMQRHAVNVPTDFYAKFTADVVKMVQEDDLGVDGRIISMLEGGYSDRALTSGVMSHICGLVDEPSTNVRMNGDRGLGSSMVSSSPPNGNGETDGAKSESHIDHYDTEWWSMHSLETIEAIVAGRQPPPPKAGDQKGPASYSSPTQASTAKMTETARERRSLSAQLEARLSIESEPLPPPPEVEWAVAAYELSRLIIPADRQTISCRHDELNAEATKVRKERQSGVGLPVGDTRELRERKAKPPPLPAGHVRTSSRTGNRRTTIASVNDLPDPPLQDDAPTVPRVRRRSSAGSSIASAFQDMNLGETRGVPAQRQATEPAPVAKPKPAPVRKPKTIATKAPLRPRSPRKAAGTAPSLSRKNSSASDKTSSSMPPISGNAQGRPPSRGKPAAAPTAEADDLENITNGLKKVSIKLKMPSAEEQAVKQKKAEEDQQKKARAPRKPPVPRGLKTKPMPKLTTGSMTTTQSQIKQASIAQSSNTVSTAFPPPNQAASENAIVQTQPLTDTMTQGVVSELHSITDHEAASSTATCGTLR